MNHKLAGCSRTWHSLWDEMFSALEAFDKDAESSSLGFGSDNDTELESWLIKGAPQSSNDNGSR